MPQLGIVHRDAVKVPAALRAHPEWPKAIQLADARIAGHGDRSRWQAALDELPSIEPEAVLLSDRVGALGRAATGTTRQLEAALKQLQPWRKGPFELFGVHIDSEWRSDWKWQRVAPALAPLDGRTVLDVGSGNGYFGWRAVGAGAREVLGVDPSVLFYHQHRALARYLDPAGSNVLLPLAFEELPTLTFDVVLSMGVVYHRRDPAAHVRRLYRFCRPGGRVLLESLVVDAASSLVPDPEPPVNGRYVRMRNVSVVPTLATMRGWLEAAGFTGIGTVDVSTTTMAEQRRTDWMTFESLAEALDPDDPGRTVEGYPAPVRAAMLAFKPG